MTYSGAEFVLLVIGYGILLWMAAQFSRSEVRRRVRSDLSKWQPRILFLGLVLIYVGINALLSGPPLQESDSLVRWGHALMGVILIAMGLVFSINMIRNWWSRRDPDRGTD